MGESESLPRIRVDSRPFVAKKGFWFWPGADGLLSAISQQKCGLSQCPSSRCAFSRHGNSRNNTVKHSCTWRMGEIKSPLRIRVDSRQFAAKKGFGFGRFLDEYRALSVICLTVETVEAGFNTRGWKKKSSFLGLLCISTT
jgi:hypothetical protein